MTNVSRRWIAVETARAWLNQNGSLPYPFVVRFPDGSEMTVKTESFPKAAAHVMEFTEAINPDAPLPDVSRRIAAMVRTLVVGDRVNSGRELMNA